MSSTRQSSSAKQQQASSSNRQAAATGKQQQQAINRQATDSSSNRQAASAAGKQQQNQWLRKQQQMSRPRHRCREEFQNQYPESQRTSCRLCCQLLSTPLASRPSTIATAEVRVAMPQLLQAGMHSRVGNAQSSMLVHQDMSIRVNQFVSISQSAHRRMHSYHAL